MFINVPLPASHQSQSSANTPDIGTQPGAGGENNATRPNTHSELLDQFLAEGIPDLLTALRPALGVAAALVLIKANPFLAFWLYSIGLLTDVLDGMFARALKSATAWGKRFDAYVDLFFIVATGFGLAYYFVINEDIIRLFCLALLLAAFIIRVVYVREHSIGAKAFCGVSYLVILALLCSCLSSDQALYGIAVSVAFVLIGGAYELHVSCEELRKGRRKLC